MRRSINGFIVVCLSMAAVSFGAVPAHASHLLCPPPIPVYEPGVGGVTVGIDTGADWRGVCINLLNGTGASVAYMSIHIGLIPVGGTPGSAVGLAICTSTAGDCPPFINATGVSTGTPGTCAGGIGFCFVQTHVYANSDPGSPLVTVANKTGVEFVLGNLVSTGPGIFAGVGCPACVHDTRIYLGAIRIYIDSNTPTTTINICAQLGGSVSPCPPLI